MENKRAPCWNNNSGFDIDHFDVICMSLFIRLPNFVQIAFYLDEIR